MSRINVACNEESFILVRFFNHAVLGLKKDIGEHDKNFIEKIGDAGLWVVEGLPKVVYKIAKDPKIVTIALTALAIFAVSVAFYPLTTVLTIKAAILLLPQVPFWAVKFSAYLSVVGLIIATSTRAMGRFVNSELMDSFYNPKGNV